MTEVKEKDILVLSDDIGTYSGFAVNGRLVTYALSEIADVANASLQAQQARTINVHGRDLDIYPARHDPYTDGTAKGKQLFSKLVNWCDPKVVVSVIDPHMCMYLGSLKLQNNVTVNLREPGQPVNVERVKRTIEYQLNNAEFEESFTWVAHVPLDGHPAPADWSQFFKEVDVPVAMSQYGHERFKQDLGVQTPIIPHAVDYREVKDMEHEDFIVGTVNRNQPRKQYPRLIESLGKFYELAGKPDDVRFYLHCDYNDSSGWDISTYLDRFGIKDVTEPYEGTVTRERLMELYNLFDVFVSATGGEGFGLTTVEAMSQETPVIITDYTTSEELVLGGSPSPRGCLVPVESYSYGHPEFSEVRRGLVDTDRFANILLEYYEDRERCKREGSSAREWVTSELDWDSVGGQWRDLVEPLL